MSKKNNVENNSDPIRILNGAIIEILTDDDIRIRKKKNIVRYKLALEEVVAKGFIRTHAIVTNWLLELFKYGELRSLTFHELKEKLPWSWDKTREYFDSLEEISIVNYSRDSQGRKTCSLTIDNEYRARQIKKLLEFYKRSGIDSRITISEIRKEYTKYGRKLNEWFCKKHDVKKLSIKITQASSSTVEKFIHDITNIITRSEEKELKVNLLEFLKKNPLLIRSLKRSG